MKKIHFNQLTFKNWTSLLMLISLVFIIMGSFEIIDFEYKRTNKILASIGFFLSKQPITVKCFGTKIISNGIKWE
jgi:hypothetical protein